MKYLLDRNAMRDMLDMYDEYMHKHRADSTQAKFKAVNETTDPDAGYAYEESAEITALRARAEKAEAEAKRLRETLEEAERITHIPTTAKAAVSAFERIARHVRAALATDAGKDGEK